MDYVTQNSDTIFKGKVFNVRIDKVINPLGNIMRVDVIEHGGAVVILPIDDENHIWFVDQYRYPTDGRILELPAGTLEANEDPEVCAKRECREEIGMSPGSLTHLGGFFIAPGYSTEYIHVYLAQQLTPSPLEQDSDEDIHVSKLSLEEVREKLTNRDIQDAKTVASLFLALQHLGVVTWK